GFEVANVGGVGSDEVVQLYLRDEVASVTRPVKQLAGFARLTLVPGASKRVEFAVPLEVLAFYDRDMRLVLEPGTVSVMVGASAADIRLHGSFEIAGETRVARRGKCARVLLVASTYPSRAGPCPHGGMTGR